MRKVMICWLALGAAMGLGTTAGAETVNVWNNVNFTAAVPCASAICPYWLHTANIDLDGNGKEDIFFQACANPDGTDDMLAPVPGLPFTEGSTYDDIVIGPAPANTKLLEVEMFPTVDWDGFICEWKSGNVAGAELALIGTPLLANCDNLVGPNNPVPLGCVERGSIEAVANKRYIIRAYNYSDTATMAGRYRFRSV